MRTVACGQSHTICIGMDGVAWGFGYDNYGQLGLKKSEKGSAIPLQISFPSQIVSVACGSFHSISLGSFGEIWALGYNNYGQLGLGHVDSMKNPQKVQNIPPIASINAGLNHTICLDKENNIWGFGQNKNGELGLGHSSNQLSPKLIASNIKAAACGGSFTLALNTSNELLACGRNSKGQLGLGDKKNRSTLTKLSCALDIEEFDCGRHHTLLLLGNGTVLGIGYNGNGSIGLGSSADVSLPHVIPNLPTIQKISCGMNHSMCLDISGDVWMFGLNSSGQLGLGDDCDRDHPIRVPNFGNVSSLSTGGFHSIIKLKDGSVWGCGKNSYGQLGTGDSRHRFIPTKLEGFSHIIAPIKLNGRWEKLQMLLGWKDEEVNQLRSIEEIVSIQNQETYQDTNCTNLRYWEDNITFVQTKFADLMSLVEQGEAKQQSSILDIDRVRKQIKDTENMLDDLKKQLSKLKEVQQVHQEFIQRADVLIEPMALLHDSIKKIYEEEKRMDTKFNDFIQNPLEKATSEGIQTLLRRLGLHHYVALFDEHKLTGKHMAMVDEPFLIELGMTRRDACCLLYHRDILSLSHENYLKTIEQSSECAICFHDTPARTFDLLQEYNINLSEQSLIDNNWIAPYLLYTSSFVEFGVSASTTSLNIRKQLETWKKIHENHLLGEF